MGCVGLSFCQSGGCNRGETHWNRSDLYWRWGTKPCTVTLVTRTTERISPVHLPGKQIRKVVAGRGKRLSVWIKIFCFWFIFCTEIMRNGLNLEHTVYQKENKQKKILSAQIIGVSFSYTLSRIVPQCSTSFSSSHPRMSLHKSTFLGRRPRSQWPEPISRVLCSKSSSRTPSSDLLLTALVLLQVPTCESLLLAVWGQPPRNSSCFPEAQSPRI